MGVVAAGVLLLTMSATAAGAVALPALTVADGTAIALTLNGPGTDDTAVVTVVNTGDGEALLQPALVGADQDLVSVSADPATVPAGEAVPVTLLFSVLGEAVPSSATLVIAAHGFAPVTVPVTVTVATRMPLQGPMPVIVFALVVGLAIVIVRVVMLRGRYPANGKLGGVRWDFASSWATNITTVGAILGTIVAGGILPEQGRLLSAGEIAGLSLAFGTVAVLAGFFYTVFQQPVVLDDGEPVRQGYVRPFLIAAAATVVAVIGELATLSLLLVDAWLQGTNAGLVLILLMPGAGRHRAGPATRVVDHRLDTAQPRHRTAGLARRAGRAAARRPGPELVAALGSGGRSEGSRRTSDQAHRGMRHDERLRAPQGSPAAAG